MKKTMVNETHIEGLLYEHSLKLKVSSEKSKNPNTTFITGAINIATDNAMLNIVPVHYTYVTEKTSKGELNRTYGILMDIISNKHKSVVTDGAENAVKLKIDSAIGLNEWYDRDDQIVSVKRNEGGFVHVVTQLNENENERNTFKVDIVITSAIRNFADEERNLPEKVTIRGAIFDFRKSLLPVEFTVLNPRAMDYFEGLSPSPKTPVFTKIWGRQVSQAVTRTYTEESAFGEASVRTVQSTRKDFVVTGAAKDAYEWDSQDTILASELVKAQSERNIALAEMKKRSEDYRAERDGGKNNFSSPAIAGYKF